MTQHSYSEFEKRTMAMMAMLHSKSNIGYSVGMSLSVVLSGYNIALEQRHALYEELIAMTSGVNL